MELQQLRYFVSVATQRNFTRAAALCNVAQPSLSQQIRKLELELGAPLFHRQGRRVVLTELGNTLLPKAKNCLQQHDDILRLASDSAGGGALVRFGSILTMAPYLVPRLFGDVGPDGSPPFEVTEDFTANLLRRLMDGELDFAIMSSPVHEPNLLAKVIAREPFVAVVPAGHELSNAAAVDIASLLAGPFLPLSSIHCAGEQIREVCGIQPSEPKATFHSSQVETILRLVEQGLGVTLLPKMAVLNTRFRVKMIPVKPPVPMRDIVLVHHPDRYLSHSARRLIEVIEFTIGNLNAPAPAI